MLRSKRGDSKLQYLLLIAGAALIIGPVVGLVTIRPAADGTPHPLVARRGMSGLLIVLALTAMLLGLVALSYGFD